MKKRESGYSLEECFPLLDVRGNDSPSGHCSIARSPIYNFSVLVYNKLDRVCAIELSRFKAME